ncbi:MAG: FtsW/RodA/SpoVE family cell cycle protein [Lachnospiraceae bacterium]|nr:FtsW/RodA/SpoVE family cell cycle protein [Lachnospiraceae bacterium]
MAYFIVIYSKYFIVLFLLLFVLCGFYSLRYERAAEQTQTANLQTVFLFLTQFSAYLTIVIRTQKTEYLIFYAFLQILTLTVPIFFSLLYKGTNRVLLNHMCMLLSAGMIILTRLDLSKAKRQLFFCTVSFVLALVVPEIVGSVRYLKNLGWLYCFIGIGAILAVLVLGQVTNGSKITFTVGGLTFQPSEFVKILYVFFLASVLAKGADLKRVVLAGIGAAVHVLILVMSKDLGSALIYFVVYVLMITIASHHLWYLAAGGIVGGGASVVAYKLFSHVQVRVQAWKDPWSVIDNQGYQITQSLFAMSRGGLFGLGIGKGTPDDIPFVETDFVFAALIEELGLLFGIGIILAEIVLFLSLMRLAAGLKDGFYKNICVGFAVLYLFQTFLTIGGGTKFIPLTGVTLPFISYGGSSIISTILMFAVILGIFELRYEEEIKIEKQRRKRAKQAD